jgi:hypothetical protein
MVPLIYFGFLEVKKRGRGFLAEWCGGGGEGGEDQLLCFCKKLIVFYIHRYRTTHIF